ncbi:MAG TPA: hypothetical protein VH558_16995 [Pseudolabrys sp.]
MSMNKVIAFLLFSAAAGVPLAGAKAMPVAPIKSGDMRLAMSVADGCGFNRYRDARGICRKKYVISRHSGRKQVYSGCGGINSHRVCNLYGHCWMVCD